MKRLRNKFLPLLRIAILFFLLVNFSASAQDFDPYIKIYAERNLRKFDKNKDKELSIDELAHVEVPFLNTEQPKKLNIKFKSTPSEDLYLDIYYPHRITKGEKFPVVYYTHGGGWVKGSKENCNKGLLREVFLEFVNQGYAVVSVNYRLVRGRSAVMKNCVLDVMDGLRYLSKHNKDLALNTNRVFVIGDSAGGQLSQMITLANPDHFIGDTKLSKYKYNIVAGISWYGPSDFTDVALFKSPKNAKNPDRFGERVIGINNKVSDEERRTLYKEMSPVFYLTAKSPPLYMMAADNDETIPLAHAYHIQKQADKVGANVEVFKVENAGHNWRNAGGKIDPTADVILQKTVAFFNAYN